MRLPSDKRWLHVALAAAYINTSYGTLSYAFAVLVTEGAAGGDFGKTFVATAFGAALLVSGLASVAVGTFADIAGTRRVLATGAAVGSLGLLLLGTTQAQWQFLLVMVLLVGPALAATSYEPVYVLMNRWFAAHERPRAYGVLTLLSGISITVYTPLAQLLVDAGGWRTATAGLAACLAVIGLAVPLLLWDPGNGNAAHARPSLRPAAFARETLDGLRQTTRRFWVFSLAFFAATVASGYSFHMLAQLETRGFEPGPAATAIAVTGLVSLPMRLALPALSGRFSGGSMLAFCLAMLGLAAWLASAAGDWWQVWLYVGIFGLVFGAIYPLRALTVSEGFAGAYFGRVIGLQALLVAVARALGPPVIGIGGTTQPDYEFAFRVAGVALVVCAAVILATARRRRAIPTLATASR